MDRAKYSMRIEWSEEDQCYVVSLPEFTRAMQPVTDGRSYEEAARRGQDALASLIDFYEAEGWPLPQPQTLQVA
jgi:antitoxin HicB